MPWQSTRNGRRSREKRAFDRELAWHFAPVRQGSPPCHSRRLENGKQKKNSRDVKNGHSRSWGPQNKRMSVRTVTVGAEVDDQSMTLLKFSDGAIAYVGTCWTSPGIFALRVFGSKNQETKTTKNRRSEFVLFCQPSDQTPEGWKSVFGCLTVDT